MREGGEGGREGGRQRERDRGRPRERQGEEGRESARAAAGRRASRVRRRCGDRPRLRVKSCGPDAARSRYRTSLGMRYRRLTEGGVGAGSAVCAAGDALHAALLPRHHDLAPRCPPPAPSASLYLLSLPCRVLLPYESALYVRLICPPVMFALHIGQNRRPEPAVRCV